MNIDFEEEIKHKNFLFSNSIDFVYEFFNFERKSKSAFLSKSIQLLGKNYSVNKMFMKIADEGMIF